MPQTIDELEAVCDKLLEAGYVPFALANSSKWTGSMYYMYLVARHSGNDEFNAAYDGTGSFTSDAFIWAGNKIQDWVKKGYIIESCNILVTDNGDDRALMYSNTCAMMLQGSWQTRTMPTENKEWYDANLGTFRFPVDSEAEAKGVPQNVEIVTAVGNAFSFNCWKEDGSVDEEKLKACYVLATQFYNDDIYNKEQMEHNTILSIKGFEEQVTDPNMKIVVEVFNNASNVQLCFNGVSVSRHEKHGLVNKEDAVSVEVCEADGQWVLKTNVYDLLGDFRDGILTTESLGCAFEPEERFENPDGTPIVFDRDFLGNHRALSALPGPFADGKAVTAVW